MVEIHYLSTNLHPSPRFGKHAVHADETYIQDQQPAVGMYTAGYYPHNDDFMAFAAAMVGRRDLAVEAAESMVEAIPPEMVADPTLTFLQLGEVLRGAGRADAAARAFEEDLWRTRAMAWT